MYNVLYKSTWGTSVGSTEGSAVGSTMGVAVGNATELIDGEALVVLPVHEQSCVYISLFLMKAKAGSVTDDWHQ